MSAELADVLSSACGTSLLSPTLSPSETMITLMIPMVMMMTMKTEIMVVKIFRRNAMVDISTCPQSIGNESAKSRHKHIITQTHFTNTAQKNSYALILDEFHTADFQKFHESTDSPKMFPLAIFMVREPTVITASDETIKILGLGLCNCTSKTCDADSPTDACYVSVCS